MEFATKFLDKQNKFDIFTKVSFVYQNAVATIKVGCGMKSEGELVISGTEGYIYVPAPWWKTDYFEVRYEDSSNNKRYFYQLDGEGIRYELADFVRTIESGKKSLYISEVAYESGVKRNPAEYMSCIRPPQRDAFFNDMYTMSFEELKRKYIVSIKFSKKVERKIKNLIKTIIRRVTVNSSDYGMFFLFKQEDAK